MFSTCEKWRHFVHESSSSRTMDFLKFYLIIFTLLFVFVPPSLSSETEDQCSAVAWWGTYRGRLSTSVLRPDVRYCSYRDIRYGEPVHGSRRFRKPMLAKPQRSRVFDATQDRVVCTQPNSKASSEDCLFLNVFTPQINEKSEISPRAVMVYIHGGAFTYGSKTSTEFSPDYLLPHDVVLVTINYRLNVFGFLNLGIRECNGNMGLHDQIVALEWIQKNIRSFGGDPKNVTLMGQSAGAISVYLLQLSPLARGLFGKVIIQSAITTDVFAKTANITVYHSIEFAKFLGYKGDSNDRHSIFRFLRDFKAADMANGYRRYMDMLAKTDDSFFYVGPPLWPYHDSKQPDAVLPTALDELGRSAANISCLIGYNNADANVYSHPYDPYVLVDYVSKHLDLYMSGTDPIFAKDKRTLNAVIANVTKYYYSADNSSNKLDDTIRLLTYLSFDEFYEQIAIFRPSYTSNKIWVYEFCYADGFQNYKKVISMSHADEVKGASHSGELEYLFYASMYSPHGFNATAKELEVIQKMSTWWTNFAKFGNPNSGSDDIELEWEPTNHVKSNYLVIDETMKFISNAKTQQKEREFFDELRQWAKNN